MMFHRRKGPGVENHLYERSLPEWECIEIKQVRILVRIRGPKWMHPNLPIVSLISCGFSSTNRRWAKMSLTFHGIKEHELALIDCCDNSVRIFPALHRRDEKWMMIGAKFLHTSGIWDIRLNDVVAAGFQRHHKAIRTLKKKSPFVSIVACEYAY